MKILDALVAEETFIPMYEETVKEMISRTKADDESLLTVLLEHRGPYPKNFKSSPEMTAKMLNSLIVDGIIPQIHREAAENMVRQTFNDKMYLLHVLLEHRMQSKYPKAVIDLLIPSNQTLDEAILDLFSQANTRYGKLVERRCGAFIVRHVLNSEPNMNITALNNKIYKFILSEAFKEAKTSQEFGVILSAELRANNGSMHMLNEAFVVAVTRCLEMYCPIPCKQS